MTNEEFVFNFLEKNYFLEVNREGVFYVDKFTCDSMSHSDFTTQLNNILGFEFVLQYTHWIKLKRQGLLRDVFNYLNTCVLVGNRHGWVLTHPEGYPVPVPKLIADLGVGFERLYEDWYANKLIEASEKLMTKW